MAAFAEETEAKNQLGHISEGDASIEERERQNRELKEGLHPLKVSRFLSSCSFFFSSYCPSFSTTFFFLFLPFCILWDLSIWVFWGHCLLKNVLWSFFPHCKNSLYFCLHLTCL